MNQQKKLILAAAAAVIVGFAIASTISDLRLRSLEREIETAKQRAEAKEAAAVLSETKAAEYKQKVEYLESEIAGIGRLARRQDEELEKVNVDIGGARRDVERAKRIRPIGTTAAELCRKLAELGHPCDRE